MHPAVRAALEEKLRRQESEREAAQAWLDEKEVSRQQRIAQRNEAADAVLALRAALDEENVL